MQGVPSSETLRQAALHASWRRDRALARRRLAWRWVAWTASRWVLPVVVAFLLGNVPVAPRDASPEGDRSGGAMLKLSRTIAPPQARPAVPETPAAGTGEPILLKPQSHFERKETK